ncbi:type III secretion system effector XopF2 [Xanthomonas theicola]|uniref:type III secretion system effector XopF2 n=1 Tax=Xanthomonas theicola TaxID=56464 RepID=UPI001FEB9B70|nr:type III secretion system effector XopF2 [Xanthomonas theicola]
MSRYEATPDAPDATETQAHLEQEYIDWAAERQLQRHAAFGPNGGYRFNVDMHATGTDASLPVAYETLKGFLTSALRVPPGSAAAAQFDKQVGELTSKLGPTVAGGAVSGLGSGFIEQILLSAIDRRARLANMPAFKPVPPTVLSPAPGPVQMEITPQGRKHFWRPLRDHQVSHVGANGDHPTLDALQGVAHDRQRQLLQRQKLMEGKAEATFLRPLLTGTFNGIRRRLSSVSTLLSPTKLLGTSMLSAGGAGALTRAILETGKALSRTGQTQIDNLVGGRQTVNLFRLARLDESTDALRWSDARRLPDTLLDIAREAGALAAQPLTSPRMAMQVARDLLLRHIGGNIFTGWVATGGGTLLASVVRGGYGTPASGEAPSSAGSVVQQYGQSFSNDTVWNSLKSALGDTRQDLAANLDRRRDDKQASLWSKALAMQNRLRLQIKAVRQPADGAQDPGLQDAIGALARSLEQGAGMIERSDLDAALDAIERVLGEPGRTDGATLERLRTLKSGAGQLRALLVQRQALLDWRGGRQQACA